MLAWWLGEGDEGWSRTLLEPFAAAAAAPDVPFIVTPVEATTIGSWVEPWREQGLVFSRGVRSTYRATAIDDFLSARPGGRRHGRRSRSELGAAPDRHRGGPIVGFDDAMRLLAEAGVAIAPYVVLGEG